MRKIRSVVLAIVIFGGTFFLGDCFGQSSLIVYNGNVIGLRSSQDRLLGGELKVFTNFPHSKIELDGLINFKKQTYHQFSAGLGLNVNADPNNFFNAVVMPLNLTLLPFQDSKSGFVRRFSFIFELCPEFYPNYNIWGNRLNIRSLYGVRFKFNE
jgi:hypothetical protein